MALIPFYSLTYLRSCVSDLDFRHYGVETDSFVEYRYQGISWMIQTSFIYPIWYVQTLESHNWSGAHPFLQPNITPFGGLEQVFRHSVVVTQNWHDMLPTRDLKELYLIIIRYILSPCTIFWFLWIPFLLKKFMFCAVCIAHCKTILVSFNFHNPILLVNKTFNVLIIPV